MLSAAGAAFELLGALLLAAEAFTAAVDAFRRHGDQRAATASANRARALAGECEGAQTPASCRPTRRAVSRREREVALLAGQGLASKDIAAQLFLSVRTVDNHLQRAYTKLVSPAAPKLADALEATPYRSLVTGAYARGHGCERWSGSAVSRGRRSRRVRPASSAGVVDDAERPLRRRLDDVMIAAIHDAQLGDSLSFEPKLLASRWSGRHSRTSSSRPGECSASV